MTKSYDPIAPIAEEISQEASLLCFDEFQVKFSFLLDLDFFIILNCVCARMGLYMWGWMLSKTRGTGSPGIVFTGGCVLPDLGSGNGTQCSARALVTLNLRAVSPAPRGKFFITTDSILWSVDGFLLLVFSLFYELISTCFMNWFLLLLHFYLFRVSQGMAYSG